MKKRKFLSMLAVESSNTKLADSNIKYHGPSFALFLIVKNKKQTRILLKLETRCKVDVLGRQCFKNIVYKIFFSLNFMLVFE